MPAPTVPKPRDSGSQCSAHPKIATPPPVLAKEVEARKVAFSKLVAQKRRALKKVMERKQVPQVADHAAAEKWSGLRITERCVRKEKWEASMKGKELIRFGQFSALRPKGRDQVVIGVLCAQPVEAVVEQTGERCAELVITDLDAVAPQTASLVLRGRAMDHWADPEGAGWRSCTVGSVFAVLNPSRVKRRDEDAVAVSYEAQVLKLGVCPSLRFCGWKEEDGLLCRRPYSTEGSHACCSLHASSSRGERQSLVEIVTPTRRRRGTARRKKCAASTTPGLELRRLQKSRRKRSRLESNQPEAELVHRSGAAGMAAKRLRRSSHSLVYSAARGGGA